MLCILCCCYFYCYSRLLQVWAVRKRGWSYPARGGLVWCGRLYPLAAARGVVIPRKGWFAMVWEVIPTGGGKGLK